MKLQVVVAVLLLAGCTHFDALPLAPEQSAAALDARSFDDPSLLAFVATHIGGASAPSTWDMDALTLAAFYFNPDLDVARAQWSVAEAARVAAGERPNPTLGLAPAYNTTTDSPSPRIVTATVDLTLQSAGKRGYRAAEAEQIAEAARLNVATIAWQVRSRVRSSLIDFLRAREAEALLENQQSVHTDNVRIVEGQYREGAISAFELSQARLAADGARLAWRDAQRQTAEARAQLASAIGVPMAALDGIALSFHDADDTPLATLQTARRQALLNRADILSALAAYAASQAKLQLEIANQYPDIQLGPGYEYDQGDAKWSLGLALVLPVFHRNAGAIAAARAQRTESAARFDALQAQVMAEVDLALAGLTAAAQKQADANAILSDTSRQAAIAQAMLEAGEIGRSDLAALQLQLGAAELARLDALLQSRRAAGRLEDALQVPLGLPETVWQDSPRMSKASGATSQP